MPRFVRIEEEGGQPPLIINADLVEIVRSLPGGKTQFRISGEWTQVNVEYADFVEAFAEAGLLPEGAETPPAEGNN